MLINSQLSSLLIANFKTAKFASHSGVSIISGYGVFCVFLGSRDVTV